MNTRSNVKTLLTIVAAGFILSASCLAINSATVVQANHNLAITAPTAVTISTAAVQSNTQEMAVQAQKAIDKNAATTAMLEVATNQVNAKAHVNWTQTDVKLQAANTAPNNTQTAEFAAINARTSNFTLDNGAHIRATFGNSDGASTAITIAATNAAAHPLS